MKGETGTSYAVVGIMRKMSQLRTMLRNEGISSQSESHLMDFVANIVNQAFEEGTRNKTQKMLVISP